MIWETDKIKDILPQREPFLFIDRVLEVEVGKRVVALKNVSGNEDFFRGHFPGNPIMPGVLIIEAMAQACILLYSTCKPDVAKTRPTYYLGKVKAEFMIPVKVGSQLIIEVKNIKIINFVGIMSAIAKVENKEVAKAELVFGVKLNEK